MSDDDDDDVDIYDDLPVLNLGESISKIEEERQLLKQQLEEKEKDLDSTKERIETLEKEKKTLEKNISALYKTAVSELQRKDQLIEELRREKDSIVFRRNRKEDQGNHSASRIFEEDFDGSDSKDQLNTVWPNKLIPVTLEEDIEQPVKTVLQFIRHSGELPDQTLESKDHHNSTSDEIISCHATAESLHKNMRLEVTNVNENVRSQKTYGSALSPNTSDNSRSKIDDASSDKLSSSSSHAPYNDSKRESDTRELLDHKSFSRERRDGSTSSENRRQRHKTHGLYSQQHLSSRNRRRSPHRRHSTSKMYYERNQREGKTWDHGNRNYHRDLHTGGNRQRIFGVDRSDNCRERHHLRAQKSPSPKRLKRHNFSPNKRYPDRRSFSSIGNRYTKPQSDNVRMAAQVKSKYSRTKCERSVSCSPVKQKTGKQSLNVSDLSPELSLERTNVNKQRTNVENFRGEDKHVDEQSVKRLHQEYITENPYSECLCLKQNSSGCDCINIKENDSLIHVKNYVNVKDMSCGHSVKPSSEINCGLFDGRHFGVVSTSGSCSVIDVESKANVMSIKKSDMSAENDNPGPLSSSVSILRLNSIMTESSRHVSKIINNEDNSTFVNEMGGLQKTQRNSDIRQHIDIEERRKFCPNIIEQPFKESIVEENLSREQLQSTNILCTPPSKCLLPLKISPSYEDPAVVNGNKFSLSVFHEQCGFKRHKRKRSVKILIADIKNPNTGREKDGGSDRPSGVSNIRKERTCTNQPEGSSERVETSVSDCSLDCTETNVYLGSAQVKDNTAVSKLRNNTVNIIAGMGIHHKPLQRPELEKSVKVSEDINIGLNMQQSSCNSIPVRDIQKWESVGKKRKVDTICEELKANLEKKNVTISKEVQLTDKHENLPLQCEVSGTNVDSSNENHRTSGTEATVGSDKMCRIITSDTVESSCPIKRTVVSRIRRRVHNLQDSVVQVLSQVKSKISP